MKPTEEQRARVRELARRNSARQFGDGELADLKPLPQTPRYSAPPLTKTPEPRRLPESLPTITIDPTYSLDAERRLARRLHPLVARYAELRKAFDEPYGESGLWAWRTDHKNPAKIAAARSQLAGLQAVAKEASALAAEGKALGVAGLVEARAAVNAYAHGVERALQACEHAMHVRAQLERRTEILERNASANRPWHLGLTPRGKDDPFLLRAEDVKALREQEHYRDHNEGNRAWLAALKWEKEIEAAEAFTPLAALATYLADPELAKEEAREIAREEVREKAKADSEQAVTRDVNAAALDQALTPARPEVANVAAE